MRFFSISNWGKSIKHHWGMLMLTFLLICSVGIPAIWFLIEPVYSVTGTIRIAPILENIWTGEADAGGISYQSFMHTQAEMITSGRVMQRVADELAYKNLAFFKSERAGIATKLKRILMNNKPGHELESISKEVFILKQAISDGVISVAPGARTEFIKITMNSIKVSEAQQIVDAFIGAYMAIEGTTATQFEDRQLTLLENEHKVLALKLKSQRENIKKLAQEFGFKSPTTFDKRQQIKLERVGMLITEVTRLEARRINLEVQVQVFEERHKKTHERSMSEEKTDLQQAQLQEKLLQSENELANTQAELELTKALEQRFKKMLDAEDTTTIDVRSQQLDIRELLDEPIQALEMDQMNPTGYRFSPIMNYFYWVGSDNDLYRRQWDMEDLQHELTSTKNMYEKIGRRIQELEMERKRPARISVAYNADIANIRDWRAKYTIVLIFGAMACGMILSFRREAANQYQTRGNAYLAEGEYAKAISDLNKAIELEPKLTIELDPLHTRAYSNRGYAYLTKGEYDKAISDFNKAIELEPKDAEAFHNRGTAYLRKGEYNKAISDLNRVIELKPKDAEPYHNRGTFYVKKGEYDKALSDFNKAIKLDPKDPEAHYKRSFTYFTLTNYQQAWDDMIKAEKLGFTVPKNIKQMLHDSLSKENIQET